MCYPSDISWNMNVCQQISYHLIVVTHHFQFSLLTFLFCSVLLAHMVISTFLMGCQSPHSAFEVSMFDASIPQFQTYRPIVLSSISMDSNGFYQFYQFYPSFSLGRTSISDFAAPKAERMPQAAGFSRGDQSLGTDPRFDGTETLLSLVVSAIPSTKKWWNDGFSEGNQPVCGFFSVWFPLMLRKKARMYYVSPCYMRIWSQIAIFLIAFEWIHLLFRPREGSKMTSIHFR